MRRKGGKGYKDYRGKSFKYPLVTSYPGSGWLVVVEFNATLPTVGWRMVLSIAALNIYQFVVDKCLIYLYVLT